MNLFQLDNDELYWRFINNPYNQRVQLEIEQRRAFGIFPDDLWEGIVEVVERLHLN